MQDLTKTIDQAFEEGLNIIAVDEHKRPLRNWKQYQSEKITQQEIAEQIGDIRCHSIAVITGKISGNLEVIDLDLKYDLTGDLFIRFVNALPSDIFAKLLAIKTRSEGYHFYYRCNTIEGNQKLAQRETTEEERIKNPDDKIRVLIETRGQGGYVLAPPSPGYSIVQKNTIPLISDQEREIILEAARSFNEVAEKVEYIPTLSQRYEIATRDNDNISPWHDYDARGANHMINLLESKGWRHVCRDGNKLHFLRPGETKAKSSGNYDIEKNWFSVFSTSTQFDAQKAYRPHAVYMVLHGITNGKDLYNRLTAEGYGTKKERPTIGTLKALPNPGANIDKNNDIQTIDTTPVRESFPFHLFPDDMQNMSSSQVMALIVKAAFELNQNGFLSWLKGFSAQAFNVFSIIYGASTSGKSANVKGAFYDIEKAQIDSIKDYHNEVSRYKSLDKKGKEADREPSFPGMQYQTNATLESVYQELNKTAVIFNPNEAVLLFQGANYNSNGGASRAIYDGALCELWDGEGFYKTRASGENRHVYIERVKLCLFSATVTQELGRIFKDKNNGMLFRFLIIKAEGEPADIDLMKRVGSGIARSVKQQRELFKMNTEFYVHTSKTIALTSNNSAPWLFRKLDQYQQRLTPVFSTLYDACDQKMTRTGSDLAIAFMRWYEGQYQFVLDDISGESSVVAEGLDDVRAAMVEDDNISIYKEIMIKYNVSRKTAFRKMKQLEEDGVLIKVGRKYIFR